MPEGQDAKRTTRAGHWFLWSITLPVLLFLIIATGSNGRLMHPSVGTLADLIFWTLATGVVGLFPVPVSRRLHLNLNYPIILAVAVLYAPITTAWVALIGSTDPREFKGEITVTKALFNRTQNALSWLVGSAAFHSVATVTGKVYIVVPSVLLASAADYIVNIALISCALHFLYATPVIQALGRLRLGAIREFLVNYVGLGFVGLVMARLFLSVGMWAVLAFIAPLAFARQMFFRNLALEEAHKELKDRGEVLRALSNRMAEERQDERMRIAAYLHDDLAQMLFRLNLQAEMAKKRLAQGDANAVSRDLDGILKTKQETSDAIRALIRDLHRSPIGRRGLAEALQSFAEDMSKGPTRVVADVVEASLPPPIQLLIYQISREATMNALKHAEANEIRISLVETDEGVVLNITDDGRGFDMNAPQPEGHFGSVMMRERALVAGGTYVRHSEIGRGTSVTATFPRVWLEEGSQLEEASENGGPARPGPSTRPPIGTTVGPQGVVPVGETPNGGSVRNGGSVGASGAGKAAAALGSLAATEDPSDPPEEEATATRPVPT